ncbi:unnamed protein product [Haemonchus placei]|uniref:MAM domain-containing protein n=1 Tax=Haemonchus placei TaxID=6290 RepID=A0A0N4W4Y1_HAEPC|nr:unnamed protein product [Haemonchus placei]
MNMLSAILNTLWKGTLGISLFTQMQNVVWSSELGHWTKIRDAVDYAKKSTIRPDTLCDIVTIVGPRRLLTESSE